MILTRFRPDITLEILPNDKGLKFSSGLTGCVSLFNADTHKLAFSNTPNSNFLAYPIAPALLFEHSLMPLNKPSFPQPLLSSDYHDTDKSSHTTGGGRRNFISLGFERAVNSDEAIRNDGLLSLLQWARDQGQRPICWLPFTFNYDAYYGVIGPIHTNPVQKYDLQAKDGWNIFDPAHLESSILFGGSAIGLDESLHHFTMLLSWVVSTFPGKSIKSSKPLQGWHGSKQPRAAGWMILFLTRAILLGYDTADQEFIDKFLAGHRPKEHLVAYIQDLITMDFPVGADNVSESTLVDIGKINGIPQIRGTLTFHECILIYCLGYVLRTNILNDPLKTQLRNWIDKRVDVVLSAAIDTRGMSYSFSRETGFTQEQCDFANATEKDKTHFYELMKINGRIRDTPRLADTELMVGALAMLNGSIDQTALMLNSHLPNPSNPAYKNLARYLDIFYGLDTLSF